MVSGWHISLHRQASDRESPSDEHDARGPQVAIWQAGLGGLEWLKELVAAGDAIRLSDNSGYPMRYTIRAGALLRVVLGDPPDARTRWASGSTDVLDPMRWPGKTTINEREIAGCQPDEWLQLEAWDES